MPRVPSTRMRAPSGMEVVALPVSDDSGDAVFAGDDCGVGEDAAAVRDDGAEHGQDDVVRGVVIRATRMPPC